MGQTSSYAQPNQRRIQQQQWAQQQLRQAGGGGPHYHQQSAMNQMNQQHNQPFQHHHQHQFHQPNPLQSSAQLQSNPAYRRAYGNQQQPLQSSLNRQTTVASQSVKKVKSKFQIDRKSFQVKRDQYHPNIMSVTFTYFTQGQANLMVILACQEQQFQDGSSVFKSSAGFPPPSKYDINGHGVKMEQGKIVIDENIYIEETLTTCRENQYYPIVFFMVSCQYFAQPIIKQSTDLTDQFKNILCCTFIKNGNDYNIKLMKHTIFYNGQYYRTQEIYGLKDSEVGVGQQMNDKDIGSQNVCIICYDEQKNTMLIPCRHLCLCYDCAKSLSEQPIARRTCPICRKEIQSFIKVEQK